MARRRCSWNPFGNKAVIPSWRSPHRTPRNIAAARRAAATEWVKPKRFRGCSENRDSDKAGTVHSLRTDLALDGLEQVLYAQPPHERLAHHSDPVVLSTCRFGIPSAWARRGIDGDVGQERRGFLR